MSTEVLFTALYYAGPFVLVPFGVVVFWIVRARFLKLKFAITGETILLEVILPKQIFRSPISMEVVLGALNQYPAGNWWERFSQGKDRAWFSLEMVSLEGKMHFYIWTASIFKHLLEAQIYAQYGDVEIREVPDYAGHIKYGLEEGWDMQGVEQTLTAPDPYPIKTYVDYGLDKEGVKEEFKTDPLTPTIEYLSGLGPGEYAFFQILVQATKTRYHKPGTWFGKQDWKAEGKQLIKSLTGQDKPKGKDGELNLGVFKLAPGEVEILKSIERSIGKIGFDCGIRVLYAGKDSSFKKSQYVAMMNLFTQYSTLNLNGFRPGRMTNVNSVLMKWVGTDKRKVDKLKKEFLEAYRLRSYFYPPYKRTPFVLNTEELATIYHYPGGVITTGGLDRIESKKAGAPTNLPI